MFKTYTVTYMARVCQFNIVLAVYFTSYKATIATAFVSPESIFMHRPKKFVFKLVIQCISTYIFTRSQSNVRLYLV
jgi:hypothetical protein